MSTNLLDTIAIVTIIAAAFGLFNHHVLRLPSTIGLMLSALVASLGALALDALAPGLGLGPAVRGAVASIDFTDALLKGMLGFLLFAGALHVNLDELLDGLGPILTLASVGLLISTAAIGFSSHYVFGLFGIHVSIPYCLVFGALISPTDPIAVLGIMKSVGAPKSLEIKVAGESLLNDGFAVVLFTVFLAFATGGGHDAHGAHGGFGAGDVARLILQEVAGGLALGTVFGYAVYRALRTLHEPNLEVFWSVALVLGIGLVASRVHASAPLACVAAGLLIGNRGRRFAMDGPTRSALDHVWSFFDEALNAILFVLVGFEVLAISLGTPELASAFILYPIGLLARLVSVVVPIALFRIRRVFAPGTVPVLTWGGLKGGISVALALSLPPFPGREAVLTATYATVICSILIQGLSIGALVRRLSGPREMGCGSENV